MKTDVVRVKTTGEGVDAALQAASAAAVYRGLDKKASLHLRLLAQEMLGMARQITGVNDADFWLESEGMSFELHLEVHPFLTGDMRRRLLDASSSGKNAAASGFMGKLRDIIDRALAADELGGQPDYYFQGLMGATDMEMADPLMSSATASIASWSMRNYRTAVGQETGSSRKAREEWDELEKSIVANIADEVKISIIGSQVEMIVYKDFAN